MLREIPLQRLLIYAAILGLLPLFLVLFQLQKRHQDLSFLKQRIEGVEEIALAKQSKQALNRRIRAHYAKADHFYIDKQLESLTFLQPEVATLKEALSQEDVGENQAALQRLEFLTGGENTLRFTEGGVISFDGIQDTPETMQRPIEINEKDLQQILSSIEGVSIGGFAPPQGKPLLLVLDFKLQRKEVVGDHETYSLLLKLIKREFS